MGWVTLNLRRMEDSVMHNNFQLELLNISRRRQQVSRNKNYQSLVINNKRRTAIAALRVDKDNAYKEYNDFNKEIAKFKDEYEKSKEYSGTSWTNEKKEQFCKVDGYGRGVDNDKNGQIDIATKTTDDQGKPLTEIEGYKKYSRIGTYTDASGAHAVVKYTEDEYKAILESMEAHKDELYDKYKTELQDYEEDKLCVNAQFDEELSMLEEETTEEENEIDLEQAQIETQLEAMNQELQSVKQSASQDIQGSTIKLA